jgi:hypothetical protein
MLERINQASEFNQNHHLGLKAEEFLKVARIAREHGFGVPPTCLVSNLFVESPLSESLDSALFHLRSSRDLNIVTSLTGLIYETIREISLNASHFSQTSDLFVRTSFHCDRNSGRTLTFPGINRSKAINLSHLPAEATDLAEYLLGAPHSEYAKWYEKITDSSVSQMTLSCLLISPLRPQGCTFSTTQFDGSLLLVNTTRPTVNGPRTISSQLYSQTDRSESSAISKLWEFCENIRLELAVNGVEIEHCQSPSGIVEILQARPLPGINLCPQGNCFRHTPGVFEGQTIYLENLEDLKNGPGLHNPVVIADFESTNLDLAAKKLNVLESCSALISGQIALILRYSDGIFNWHLPSALLESYKFKFIGQTSKEQAELKSATNVRLQSNGLFLRVEQL